MVKRGGKVFWGFNSLSTEIQNSQERVCAGGGGGCMFVHHASKYDKSVNVWRQTDLLNISRIHPMGTK